MAKRYKRKTPRRRPTYRKRRKNATPKASMKLLKCSTSFPDRMRVKLHFAATPASSLALAAASASQWRIIAGKQPMDIPIGTLGTLNPQGWDQWSSIYQVYRVLGCKLKVIISVNQIDIGSNVLASGYWSNESSIIGTYPGITNNRFTRCRIVTPNSNFYSRTFIRPWHVLGIPYTQYMTDVSFEQSVANNPSDRANYYLDIRNVGTTAVGLFWMITGDLYVEFKYPKTLVDVA